MFKSHPDKLLKDHFKEVYEIGINFLGNSFADEYRILAYCHDFGKYTSYFQNYLNDNNKTNMANHGFISALFGSFIALKTFGEDSIKPLLLYNIILHHHGSIKNITDNLPKKASGLTCSDSSFFADKVDIAKKQIEDIKLNREIISKDYEEIKFCDYFNEFIDLEDIVEIFIKLNRINYKLLRKDKGKNNGEYYFFHNLLFSALVAADKLSASNTLLSEVKYGSFDELLSEKDRYLGNNKTSHEDHGVNFLNSMRVDVFNSVQKSLNEKYNEKVFSITSPTGSGKTLTGFFAALKLRDLLGGRRKIIYALPFTSIINQNYEVLYNLFKGTQHFQGNASHYIIKHHSLANVDYESEFYNYNLLQSEMLMESWNSGVIVTTFVQLLETLISNSNRMLKKFNSLKGSIILLDEVQAIDIKYYPLVDYILNRAVEYLDCRIIMMTATKPMLLRNSVELLENNEKYFKKLNRTRLIPKLDKITIDEFLDSFISDIKEDKSYLIICNTINQSIEIYNRLSNIPKDIYYLSTNLLPIHRRKVIKNIQDKLKSGKKLILVSTQVVEAGVDLDFDEIIRTLAPLDSIIQGAGRCNRNNSSTRGDVFIFNMINSSGMPFGQSVYGKTSLNITKELLSSKNEFLEEEYLNLINDYFIKVNDNLTKDDSNEFINSLNTLKFSKVNIEDKYAIENFSLIEDKGNYIDVFFQIDEKAKDVFCEFKEAFEIINKDERNSAFIEVRPKVRDYILSLPSKYYSKFQYDEVSGMYYMPLEGVSQYYNENIGFLRNDDEKDYIIF